MEDIKAKLSEKGLRITPQRVRILEAIYHVNHPTADDILQYLKQKETSVATGTVYKVLETYVKEGLIRKITTDRDVIRYDGLMRHHHHLHSTDTLLIKDYIDEELDEILQAYFERKGIEGFDIEEIKLHINGKFTN